MADDGYEPHANHRYCKACDVGWYGPQKCEFCGAFGSDGPIVRLCGAVPFNSGSTPAKWVADINDPEPVSRGRSGEPGHAR